MELKRIQKITVLFKGGQVLKAQGFLEWEEDILTVLDESDVNVVAEINLSAVACIGYDGVGRWEIDGEE